MGRKRVLAGISVAIAAMAVGLAPAAAAYAGGTPAPSVTGGSEYGAALANVRPLRPVASIFTVNPKVVVAPRLPRLRVRVDQPGARSVHARLVFRPTTETGAIVRVDGGLIHTGTRLAVTWPAGSRPARRGRGCPAPPRPAPGGPGARREPAPARVLPRAADRARPGQRRPRPDGARPRRHHGDRARARPAPGPGTGARRPGAGVF